jgi:hypothetical protein
LTGLISRQGVTLGMGFYAYTESFAEQALKKIIATINPEIIA